MVTPSTPAHRMQAAQADADTLSVNTASLRDLGAAITSGGAAYRRLCDYYTAEWGDDRDALSDREWLPVAGEDTPGDLLDEHEAALRGVLEAVTRARAEVEDVQAPRR